jgi:hypothetical protein
MPPDRMTQTVSHYDWFGNLIWENDGWTLTMVDGTIYHISPNPGNSSGNSSILTVGDFANVAHDPASPLLTFRQLSNDAALRLRIRHLCL